MIREGDTKKRTELRKSARKNKKRNKKKNKGSAQCSNMSYRKKDGEKQIGTERIHEILLNCRTWNFRRKVTTKKPTK